MTFLEGEAAVMAFVTWLPEVRMRGAVELRDANIGFCYAWRNGHSRDLYIYTLTKAISEIAGMTEVHVEVTHVLRRTDVGNKIVDNLSKNMMGQEDSRKGPLGKSIEIID